MSATKAALCFGGITHGLTRCGRSAFFLSVWRTVSRLTGLSRKPASTPRLTKRSARSRTVQRARPAGGSEQASAMRWASATPSILGERPGTSLRTRSAASRPSVTKRRRVRATVAVPQPSASATFSSLQPEPWSKGSSISRRMRACWMRRAGRVPVRVSWSRRSRCSSERQTEYLAGMAGGEGARGMDSPMLSPAAYHCQLA